MKKKNLILFLVFAIIFTLVGCSKKESAPPDGGKNQIVDGTYKGEGTGKGGIISLELTIKDDKIIGINLLSHNETTGFDTAMETLREKMIETNSVDVDMVSGCTLTSTGFIEAINDALKNANASKEMLVAVSSSKKIDKKDEVEESHDVVIIGAGGAGLAAAIEAKENGADVIILEKMPLAGGNTLISGAEMAASGNWLQKRDGIEDSVETHIKDTLDGGDNIADKELVRVVAEGALEAAEWLRDDVGVVWEDELMQFGGHSIKRSLVPEGASGKEIIGKQLTKIEELKIPLLLNTKATELIKDEAGKIVGVKAESEDKSYTFKTNKGVILASGGFGSNVEMRIKYNPEIDGSILSTNSPGITGDGIVMAENAGAELVGMEYIQTYPICDPLTGTLLYFDDARLYGHTVIVNKEGKRFVEELGRRDVMSMGIKAQTGHVAYEILDQNGFDDSKLLENHSPELDYLYKNNLLVKADTLEEAAKFFDLDIENVKKTVADYNSYVEKGQDPEFNKRSLPSKIEKGPFYILKAAPAVHHTMGGIKIDKEAQVINTKGDIIDGLYAAGEVTGGIHGKNRLGSNAIADIMVFGRIAGRNAAKK